MIPARTNGTYHHAYIIETHSESQSVKERLLSWVKQHLGFSYEQNPNYIEYIVSNFSIDTVRDIHVRHADKPFEFQGQIHRVWLIIAEHIPSEAQNALLKILEEPKPHNTFFILIPNSGVLLPTLASRVEIIRDQESHVSEYSVLKDFPKPDNFEKASVSERCAYVTKILKLYDDEKCTKAHIQQWINQCLEASKKSDQKIRIRRLKAYTDFLVLSTERGSSLKLLLENCALQ